MIMRTLVAAALLSIVIFASCENILEVPDISKESVVLLAPSDSSSVIQSNVNFTWNEIFEATQYHVQIAAPSFENASQIVLDTLIVVDSAYTGPSLRKTLIDNDYEWRVKALNSGYETEFALNRFAVQTSGN